MQFEYDRIKSESNLDKHGIDFEVIKEIWDGAYCEIGTVGVSGERRRIIVGKVFGEYWTAVVTNREQAIRIISARRSTAKECSAYEKSNYRRRI